MQLSLPAGCSPFPTHPCSPMKFLFWVHVAIYQRKLSCRFLSWWRLQFHSISTVQYCLCTYLHCHSLNCGRGGITSIWGIKFFTRIRQCRVRRAVVSRTLNINKYLLMVLETEHKNHSARGSQLCKKVHYKCSVHIYNIWCACTYRLQICGCTANRQNHLHTW